MNKAIKPRKVTRISVGPKKAPVVAKIRRSKKQAYGDRSSWEKIRRFVIARDGHKCVKCGSTEYLQVDHIIEVSRGGLTIPANLRTLCKYCHAKRPSHRKARHLILNESKKSKKPTPATRHST